MDPGVGWGRWSEGWNDIYTLLCIKFDKESTWSAGDAGSTPGSGKSLGGGHGNPLQYSGLEHRLDRGASQAIVHRVAQSQTRLKRLSTQHTCIK